MVCQRDPQMDRSAHSVIGGLYADKGVWNFTHFNPVQSKVLPVVR
jgi:hypothetical protein